jgi:hypothetical protein
LVVPLLKQLLDDLIIFSEYGSGIRLRRYQVAVAKAIARSVKRQRGLSFVVIFPRQSGKNELQAQIETYLLTIYSPMGVEMVKVSPTWKPQTLNAMRRLEQVLSENPYSCDRWNKESGYIYRIGDARIAFLSGEPTANVVGATASLLLECDEAQEVLISKWDKDFLPMVASTNATRVYWGTMWTSKTLLARELRAAREAEKRDGIRRSFIINAEDVAKEVPEYGQFVAEQVAKMGRQHPIIKSQFFSEEIDAEGGMFPARRLALMQGDHLRKYEPDASAKGKPGKTYAITIDVAGEDEAVTSLAAGDPDAGDTRKNSGLVSQYTGLTNPRRDATALTIFEVDLSTLTDDLIKAPTYKVVDRTTWVGQKHTTLYGNIRAIIELWRAAYVVIDATGVGLGLSSFLEKAFPGKVLPFTFNSATKSQLGWQFLAVVETGRFKDWTGFPPPSSSPLLGGRYDEHDLFFEQCKACQMEIMPGPERRMKWGVPDGTRDHATGELIHDDLLLSAALCAALDEQEWTVSGTPVMVQRRDPISEMDNKGW